jgi:hypothetical protein
MHRRDDVVRDELATAVTAVRSIDVEAMEFIVGALSIYENASTNDREQLFEDAQHDDLVHRRRSSPNFAIFCLSLTTFSCLRVQKRR